MIRILSLLGVVSVAFFARAEEPVQRDAYFGDLHVHTSWSFDAYISNVRTTPDDAYRFARGEAIQIAGGGEHQLSRPLDFMAVTDHAEFMGVFLKMTDPTHPISTHPLAPAITSGDPRRARGAFFQITAQAAAGNRVGEEYMRSPDEPATIWKSMVEFADKHYAPGEFTTFPAYEWSSLDKFVNLHRNVIFRDSANVPDVPFSMLDSPKPEDLWAWMDEWRAQGVTLLAIPHNANMSKGRMYPLTDSFDDPLDRDYAETRRRNEPINEVIQIKGQSMTHPVLNTEDEFAQFETYNFTVGSRADEDKEVPPGSYVQEALQRGLALEEELGLNPFEFGIIGASDSHNSNSPAEEKGYPGSSGEADADPKVRLHTQPNKVKRGSGGLAGVWAEENTREAIYAALERKETFATSGPRMRVRFFGGWNLDGAYDSGQAMAEAGYANGVPMGGRLGTAPRDASPTFLVWAMKDPESANLDRVQVIKGVLENGDTREEIFTVALSDGRTPNADGSIPGNGATVDVKTGTYANDTGAVELSAVWTDPDFDPAERAYYFVRVLENPTPRWSTFDAIALGEAPPELVPSTIRERAWSSPIWYSPVDAG